MAVTTLRLYFTNAITRSTKNRNVPFAEEASEHTLSIPNTNWIVNAQDVDGEGEIYLPLPSICEELIRKSMLPIVLFLTRLTLPSTVYKQQHGRHSTTTMCRFPTRHLHDFISCMHDAQSAYSQTVVSNTPMQHVY